ncbi:MAG: ABC transporter permease [Ignisphaera sp.]|uniref:ABC transporter permease n=1 Tax=Ignisphaera aggregans TaxID=334771 RepID=A0A7C4NPP6_9CREN
MTWVKQVYAFIVRDLKIVVADKVTLFWLLAWPIIWIILVAYIFVPPGAASPVKLVVGVVNYDTKVEGLNFISMQFVEIMSNVSYGGERIFNVKNYSNKVSLISDLKKGRLDVGIVIPANFSFNLTVGTARIDVFIGARDPYSASISYSVISGFLNEFSRRVGLIKANVTLLYFKESLKYINQSYVLPGTISSEFVDIVRAYIYGIALPLNITYEEVKPEALATRANIIGWYTIGAIGMMFLYMGFSRGAAAIYEEKAYGTLRRILASPITPRVLVAALMLSNMVILLVSTPIILLAGVYIAGANISFNPTNLTHWLIPLLLIAAAYMSIGIGLILSLFTKTSVGGASLGTILGLILSFTAGIWFPKTWIPSWLQSVADYFPFTWIIDAIRNIVIYGATLNDIWIDLAKILLALITIIYVDIAIYKVKIRNVITSY